MFGKVCLVKPLSTTQRLRAGLIIATLAFVGITMIAPEARADGKTFDLGVDARYSSLSRQAELGPALLHGTGIGGHITYTINDAWRISVNAGHVWFESYMVLLPPPPDEEGQSDPNDDPNPEEEEEPVVMIFNQPQVSSAALSIEYMLDITRVLPFFALGFIVNRSSEEIDGELSVNFDLGYRLSLGFDFMFTDYFSAGIALYSDAYLLENTVYTAQLSALVRASICFDTENPGLCRSDSP